MPAGAATAGIGEAVAGGRWRKRRVDAIGEVAGPPPRCARGGAGLGLGRRGYAGPPPPTRGQAQWPAAPLLAAARPPRPPQRAQQRPATAALEDSRGAGPQSVCGVLPPQQSSPRTPRRRRSPSRTTARRSAARRSRAPSPRPASRPRPRRARSSRRRGRRTPPLALDWTERSGTLNAVDAPAFIRSLRTYSGPDNGPERLRYVENGKE